MNIKKRAFSLSVLIVFITFINACSRNDTDLRIYMSTVKMKPAKPIEPIPQFLPLASFKFPENENRRSPFKPVEQNKNDSNAPDRHRIKQPLEEFPLENLKFVGTLKEGDSVWALIQRPDSQIIRVRVGDYMGRDYGRISQISNDFLKLEETIKTSGKWEKQSITINMYTGKKGV